jgi:hypothetical protein
MTFIQVYHAVDGCEIPEGHDYLMVVSYEVDANGNWIPSRIEPVTNSQELRGIIRKLFQSGDKFVIRCSRNLWGIPAKMGIPMLHCEWGVL